MPSLALISGGLDSCVALAVARQDGLEPTHALTILYGQRHDREIRSAREIAEFYELQWTELTLPIGSVIKSSSALLDSHAKLPRDRAMSAMTAAVPRTYVPGRNTLMLAAAQSCAEAWELDAIIVGFNAVDYSGYPDCRPIFVEAWNHLARFATKRGYENNPILLIAPIINWSKEHIIRVGLELAAPLHLTWSCYAGGPKACGHCDSCIIRLAAFREIGVPDPIDYY